MMNVKPLHVGLRTYEDEAKAAAPFAVKKEEAEQTAKSDAGAYKIAQQLSAKGEIYGQRMWWA